MCPESSAWVTKTRLEQARVIATANEPVSRTVVRALKILAPCTVSVSEPANSEPEPATAPAGPPRTRETASDGYRRAVAAHKEAARSPRVGPAIVEAVERQTKAMRELSRRAFLAPNTVPDYALAPIEQARIERRAAKPTPPTPLRCAGLEPNAAPVRPVPPTAAPSPKREVSQRRWKNAAGLCSSNQLAYLAN